MSKYKVFKNSRGHWQVSMWEVHRGYFEGWYAVGVANSWEGAMKIWQHRERAVHHLEPCS